MTSPSSPARLTRWITYGLMACALAASLAACGRSDPPPSATPGATPSPAAATPADDGAKLNAYIRVHNVLVNAHGFADQRQQYERALVDAQRNTNPGLSVGWLDRAVRELKEAQAMPSSAYAELDKAGARLLPAMDSLRAELEPLAASFDAKQHTDDRGARALAGKGRMLALFDAAIRAEADFGAALEAVADQRTARRIDTLKGSGDVLAYQLALAMTEAKALLRGLQRSIDAAASAPRSGTAKAARFDTTATDATLKRLEAALAESRAEIARRKGVEQNPNGGGLPWREAEPAVGALTELAGQYRSFRDTGAESAGQKLVMAYNNAIGYYGRVPQPN